MKIQLEGGPTADTLSLDRNVLRFRSPRAFAPGAPIRFTATVGESKRTFEGRSLGSTRADDDAYEVRMRFVNLRRDDRRSLSGAIGD